MSHKEARIIKAAKKLAEKLPPLSVMDKRSKAGEGACTSGAWLSVAQVRNFLRALKEAEEVDHG